MEKYLKRILPALVVVFAVVLGFTTSADFAQDLGRHLKLGQIIMETGAVPATNLFSYTNPAFPFVNHHWFAEVAFFALMNHFGPVSLIVLKTVLTAMAVLFVYKAAAKVSFPASAATVSFLVLPLLAERLDIRPELFGYFLFAMSLYLLFFQDNAKRLFLIPLIMLLWVNLHITFVFGFALVGLWALSRIRRHPRLVVSVVLATLAASCLNPHGAGGVLYPFAIFGNYGYTIVENQNMFFLNGITFNPFIRYFFLMVPFLVLALVVLAAKKRYMLALILLVFSLLPVWQIRHLPFFVLASIPPLACAYGLLGKWIMGRAGKRSAPVRLWGRAAVAGWGVLLIFLFAGSVPYRVFDRAKSFGYGYRESQKQATDFILSQRLPGRLFNNFDIGGYAIYRLYPAYPVYVDNRPEAYPASFFRDVYIKLQEDDGLRKKVFAREGIHTVLFSPTDATPWGASFLSHILADPEWKLVFVNDTSLVLTDEKGRQDVRGQKGYFENLVAGNEDYSSLFNLAVFFNRLGLNGLTEKALAKAQRLNPGSCALTRIAYQEKMSSPYFDQGQALRNSSWWCF